MTTLPITLEDEDHDFLRQALQSGQYQSESEVVADALAEKKARLQGLGDWSNEVWSKLQEGIEQAERGDFVEFTAADVKAAGRARLSRSNQT